MSEDEAVAGIVPQGFESTDAHPLRLSPAELGAVHALVIEMEQQGKVTRTFRRLEPEQQTEIVDVVLREASRRGPQGITMRSLAKRLGVSAATLYTYFEDREAMVAFAMAVATRLSILAAGDKSDPGPWVSLEQGLQEHLATDLDYLATHWSIVMYVAQAGYHGEPMMSRGVAAPMAIGMQSRVRRLLEEASAQGELREDLDPDVVSRVVNALLLVLGDARIVRHLNDYLQLYTEDEADLDLTIHTAIEIITRGVCRSR